VTIEIKCNQNKFCHIQYVSSGDSQRVCSYFSYKYLKRTVCLLIKSALVFCFM